MRVSNREVPVRKDEIRMPMIEEIASRLSIDVNSIDEKPLREYLTKVIRGITDWLREVSNVVNSNEGAAIYHSGNLPTPEAYWHGRLLVRAGAGYQGEDGLRICLFNGSAYEWVPLGAGGQHLIGSTIGYQGNWRDDPTAGAEPASFYRGYRGNVYFHGSIDYNGVPAGLTTVCTLPVGYRPKAPVLIIGHSSLGNANLIVQTNGNIDRPSPGGGGYQALVLDGEFFQADY
jgi:hypothetical protein